jgi:hypothetical protein
MEPTDTRHSGAQARRLAVALQIAAVICLTAALVHAASAQAADQASGQPGPVAVAAPPSDPPKIEFLATPYVWLPWTYAGVHPKSRFLSSTSSIIGPDRFAKHLTWVPFLGGAEVRSGAFGVVVDYIHAPLTKGLDTGRILLGSGTGGIGVDTGTAMFFYRPLRGPVDTLDVGVGVRAWGFSGAIALSRDPLPPINVGSGAAFADPLLGARYRRDLGNGFAATAYGDVGGGAGADLQWQVVTTIDYKKPKWPELHFGFRDESFSYKGTRARFIVNMFGPVMVGTYRF